MNECLTLEGIKVAPYSSFRLLEKKIKDFLLKNSGTEGSIELTKRVDKILNYKGDYNNKDYISSVLKVNVTYLILLSKVKLEEVSQTNERDRKIGYLNYNLTNPGYQND